MWFGKWGEGEGGGGDGSEFGGRRMEGEMGGGRSSDQACACTEMRVTWGLPAVSGSRCLEEA